MTYQFLDIEGSDRHLALEDGFVRVSAEGQRGGNPPEHRKVALDDVCAIAVTAYGATYTNALLSELSRRSIPLVVCGRNHVPCGILLGLDGNHRQAKRFDLQASASHPMRKRAWQQIVRSKLQQQGRLLDREGRNGSSLYRMARRVRSGDPENIEAAGARYYWKALFGADFKRDRALPGVNGLLNYGYMVLRSTMARSVVATGLHPSLSIHHQNEGNPMRLVDDLIEPFRPVVDSVVLRLLEEGFNEVDRTSKPEILAGVFNATLEITEKQERLPACCYCVCQSLVKVYSGDARTLSLPLGLVSAS